MSNNKFDLYRMQTIITKKEYNPLPFKTREEIFLKLFEETGELYSVYRKEGWNTQHFNNELADVFITLLFLATKTNTDLLGVTLVKLDELVEHGKFTLEGIKELSKDE